MSQHEIKDQRENPLSRGKYISLAPIQKLVIARMAVRIGIHATIKHWHLLPLKYMTVKSWRDKYLKAKREKGCFIL